MKWLGYERYINGSFISKHRPHVMLFWNQAGNSKLGTGSHAVRNFYCHLSFPLFSLHKTIRQSLTRLSSLLAFRNHLLFRTGSLKCRSCFEFHVSRPSRHWRVWVEKKRLQTAGRKDRTTSFPSSCFRSCSCIINIQEKGASEEFCSALRLLFLYWNYWKSTSLRWEGRFRQIHMNNWITGSIIKR